MGSWYEYMNYLQVVQDFYRTPTGSVFGQRQQAEICLAEIRALVDEMTKRGHEAEALIYGVAKEAGVSKLAHAGRQRTERSMRR